MTPTKVRYTPITNPSVLGLPYYLISKVDLENAPTIWRGGLLELKHVGRTADGCLKVGITTSNPTIAVKVCSPNNFDELARTAFYLVHAKISKPYRMFPSETRAVLINGYVARPVLLKHNKDGDLYAKPFDFKYMPLGEYLRALAYTFIKAFDEEDIAILLNSDKPEVWRIQRFPRKVELLTQVSIVELRRRKRSENLAEAFTALLSLS